MNSEEAIGVSLADLREAVELWRRDKQRPDLPASTVLWLLDRIKEARELLTNAGAIDLQEFDRAVRAWLASVEETP